MHLGCRELHLIVYTCGDPGVPSTRLGNQSTTLDSADQTRSHSTFSGSKAYCTLLYSYFTPPHFVRGPFLVHFDWIPFLEAPPFANGHQLLFFI